jgi:hypothetical protein
MVSTLRFNADTHSIVFLLCVNEIKVTTERPTVALSLTELDRGSGVITYVDSNGNFPQVRLRAT